MKESNIFSTSNVFGNSNTPNINKPNISKPSINKPSINEYNKPSINDENNGVEPNSSLVLYHGSDRIIEKPEYGKGALYNDYGQGFYCTENKYEADLWASNRFEAYTNKYELDLSGLSILRLDNKNVLQWAAILGKFRNREDLSTRGNFRCDLLVKKYYDVDIRGYDVVIGYRADDSYFKMMQAFFEENLTLEDLSKAITLGNLGYQVVLISKKAFNQLKFINSELIDVPKLRLEKRQRDRRAKNEFMSLERNSATKRKGFITDYID